MCVHWDSNPLPLLALLAPEPKEAQAIDIIVIRMVRVKRRRQTERDSAKASDIPFRRLPMFSPHPISILSVITGVDTRVGERTSEGLIPHSAQVSFGINCVARQKRG